MAVCRASRVTMPINRCISHTFSCKRVQSASTCTQRCDAPIANNKLTTVHGKRGDQVHLKSFWWVEEVMAVFGLRVDDGHWHLRRVYWPNTRFANVPWRESAWKKSSSGESNSVTAEPEEYHPCNHSFVYTCHSEPFMLCITTCWWLESNARCKAQHFPTRAQTFCSDQRWAKWFISLHVQLHWEEIPFGPCKNQRTTLEALWNTSVTR